MESANSMSKHSVPNVDKKIERVEVTYKASESSDVAVRLIIDAKMLATGYVTGNSYEWDRAGAVVNVDERDVESLLEKRQGGRQCCGGTGRGNVVFELA